MDIIKEKIKSGMVTKGFLTIKGQPTQRSLEMFFVYLSNLPKNYKGKSINQHSLKKVREYFGVDYGFEVMLTWGMNLGCAKSITSKGRYGALSKSYNLAKSMVAQGFVITKKELLKLTE